MTVREIAEAVNKEERTIQRWIKKLSDKMSSVNEKSSLSSPMNPADYTLDETIQIIKVGLGVNAAYIFRQNAENRKAISVQAIMPAPVDYQIIGKMIGIAITAALTPVVEELKQIKNNKSLQIEQPRQDYYSLVGYCSLNKIKVSVSELKKMGMDLRKMAIDRDSEIKKIPDERWGTVNSYPIEVLDEYFRM